jgi:16S rRNA (cytidine1402-2'-O)-methyltransferase
MAGSLYVVGTPIGNSEDITLRALRVLRTVDVIAAEDPRQSRPWLAHHGIATPLTSYHRLNKEEKTAVLLRRLLDGQAVALIVDAGTPAVSDPGSFLIAEAQAAHIPIVPVPGASAVVTALSVCGFATDGFVFCGLLPRHPGVRGRRLATLRSEFRPLVLFEAAGRLGRTLQDILDCLGNRRILVAGDLTKPGEFLLRGRVAELVRSPPPCRLDTEITLVLEGRRNSPARVTRGRGHRATTRRVSGS